MHGRGLVLVALAACGGASATTVARPKLEAVDPETAEKGAKDLVQELYQDVGHGNTDSLQALLDPKLMVLGPRRGDAVANRTDAILALGRYADAKKKLLPQLRSGALGVFPSDGGHSAWGFDTLDANGEHWAVMAVMSGTNDLWSLDGVMLGDTPPVAKLKAEHKKDAVVPPAAGVTVKADPAISGIVEQFTAGLANQAAWGNELELVIGPAAGDVTRGKKDIKALWKKRGKANTRATLAGEVSGAATKDGMLAWVSAPIMRAEEGEDAMPLRAFAVFRRAGATWQLVGLQESAALDAPGAGAPFKKFAPATAAPPPPDEKAAVKVVVDDKPAKKSKSKKKKKVVEEAAPVDDAPPKKARKKKGFGASDDDAETGVPTKKFKKKPADDDAAEEAPKKTRKKVVDEDAPADDPPKKKTRKKVVEDDLSADDEAPKKKAKKASQDDDDDSPKPKKKQKKKPVDEDDVRIDE